MNITIISKTIGAPHGASQSGLDLVLACNQNNHKVTLIHKYGSKLPAKIDGHSLKNINVLKAPKNFTINTDINTKKIKRFIDSKLFDSYRNKKLSNLDTDLVIVNTITGHDIYAQSNFYNHKNSILVIRESPRHFTFKKDGKKALEQTKILMKNYKKFIFVSSNVMYEWQSIFTYLDKNCFYLPNCIHENQINQLKSNNNKPKNFNEKNFNIICVASIQFRKGQDIILDHVNKIKQKVPNAKFHFVGNYKKNDLFYSNLIEHDNYKKFQKDIIFWGKRKDVTNLIALSDLFLFPTRAEALPRVILEAMVIKTPIISSNVDGIPEMLNKNNSILFSLNNSNEMIDAISLIYNNKIDIKSLTDNAYEDYWEKFSRQKQFKRMNEIIKKVNNNEIR